MPLSNLTPQTLKRSALYQRLSRERRVRRLRKEMAVARPLNVIIGAGPTKVPGWFHTDKEILDISSPDDWRNLFEPELIDRLFAEHVLEHLSETEGRTAVVESYRCLKSGGLFRIAVPDGYRRDAAYVAEASPPNDGHQVFYTIDTLTQLLVSVGFSVTPLEYFDENEQFHARSWDESDGLVMRSARFDCQQDFQRGDLYYTSLILDAHKP